MRAADFITTLLAATALASAVPQAPAENAELLPIDDPTGKIDDPQSLQYAHSDAMYRVGQT